MEGKARAIAVCIGCAAALALGSAGAGALSLEEVTPAQSDEVLVNPGMGIYLMGTLNPEEMPADAWFRDLVTIGYFRDDWAALAGEAEGEYRFEEYFEPIFDLWVNRWGKRVAFRIMSSNMHSRREYVSPPWVFEMGVPSVVHRGLYADRQVDPVFWDETYLEIQERFIADLGAYLDGRPGLEFIDIGCIGEWGEMHLQRWTPEQLEATGFSDTRWVAAYRRIIDAFARAFPNTRVFLNVGDYGQINDYAALRGLHFRQDGLTPAGPSADVGKRFYHPYSRRGVICNYEFHSGYWEMKQRGWGIRETFEKGLEDPISYLHINLMWYHDLREAPGEVREAVEGAARRVGFRFVLERLAHNPTVRVGADRPGRLVLEQRWRNLGVAPCYDSYALRWDLVGAGGEVVASALTFPRHPTTLWWPGEEVAVRDMMSVPAEVAPGRYRLKVAMVKPEEPGLRIQLGLAGRDAEGRYEVGEVVVAREHQPVRPVYEEGFEEDLGGWSAAEGMSLRLHAEARTGARSLLMEGEQPGTSWNYASLELPVPVLPYSRYRLSCWMKVEAIEPEQAPYFKLGVSDADGGWIKNFNTNAYDLTRPGTWQRLVTYAETPPETAGGHLAVEKGRLEASVAATIRIDDVRLELLESP